VLIGKWLSPLSASFLHLSINSRSLSADSEVLLSDLMFYQPNSLDIDQTTIIDVFTRSDRTYVSFKLQPYISLTTIVTHLYYGILTYGEMNEMEDSSGKTIEQTKKKSTGCPVSPRWTILL
jgi:hypothetical protein